jgi:uncharacterized protein YutE (UPF0331/DUF86 family)
MNVQGRFTLKTSLIKNIINEYKITLPNHLCFTFYKKKMIPQSARQFNDILKQEDIINEKYYEQLEKIN